MAPLWVVLAIRLASISSGLDFPSGVVVLYYAGRCPTTAEGVVEIEKEIWLAELEIINIRE